MPTVLWLISGVINHGIVQYFSAESLRFAYSFAFLPDRTRKPSSSAAGPSTQLA
jgi:hypothetical protein